MMHLDLKLKKNKIHYIILTPLFNIAGHHLTTDLIVDVMKFMICHSFVLSSFHILTHN